MLFFKFRNSTAVPLFYVRFWQLVSGGLVESMDMPTTEGNKSALQKLDTVPQNAPWPAATNDDKV